ncbi:MAG: biotin carboxylase [bacterium]|nr:biotin carboxylase [bacterium]
MSLDHSISNHRNSNAADAAIGKYRGSDSPWVSSFACAHLKVLIVCRGPIRKEAMDVCDELGAPYGILLSEKDSVTYAQTLAPELREINQSDRVHRVPDYMGVGHAEKIERIEQIIQIARDYKYTHIFAGYGFMAEDGGFVKALEDAGISFIGPASGVHFQAGVKDMAKVIARNAGVSVTPGIDNISALALIAKAREENGDDVLAGLKSIADANGLSLDSNASSGEPEDVAEALLQAGYKKGVGLVSIPDLQKEAHVQCAGLFEKNKGYRLRFKYIGGGGGKGQRLVETLDDIDNAVNEVLAESKATGDADNKNFLIELNIENTRHNEIQLIGNGEWCIALGGRDCSLQMHEQKLVELSITEELYNYEIEQANKEGRSEYAEVIKGDAQTLKKMEEQAEAFGTAVKLNSASTFECIVSGTDFFFMEMNTRIQVEHRVTEMVYSMEFTNPDNSGDKFVVESIVEAMILIAAHSTRLPRPKRIQRNRAGGEIRLNATNDALQPHAGGMIEAWSSPVEHEIRDDQGIGVRNPDTGWFIQYHLAGAYDSNIALVVSYGKGRRQNLERLADILRRMEIRGPEVNTNRDFHYGILNFCLGLHPMLKPDTKFVVPYLAAIGSLAQQMESFDLESAWRAISKNVAVNHGPDGTEALRIKQTLMARPLEMLLDNPHMLAGWLMRNHNRAFAIEGGKVAWKRNPFRALADLYHFCHLEDRPHASPAHKIWPDDQKLLERGLEFYKDLEAKLGVDSDSEFQSSMNNTAPNVSKVYAELDRALLSGSAPQALASDAGLFQKCAAAHRGWQSGMKLLEAVILMGERSGIFEFGVNAKMEPVVPARFLEDQAQEDGIRALAPPPVAAADTLVAVSGGMFYSKESPDRPSYLTAGQHFETGDPIYIIEVMKMFNKVYAEFPGTVEEVLVDGEAGNVVKKGQPLFRVKPDIEIKIETEEEKASRRQAATLDLLAAAGE